MREVALPDHPDGLSSIHSRVEVLATFVADPILEILRYWSHEFRYETEFLPTSYGQIFVRLLESTELFQPGDIHVVLFALRDLIPEGNRAKLNQQTHANVHEFVKALSTGISTRGGTWIVVRCLDPTPENTEEVLRGFNQQAAYIEAHAKELAQTLYLDATHLGSQYHIAAFFDTLTDQHAHIPYTDVYYTAIATSIFRAIRSRLGQVYKLIVTDCDGTLWDGICGEMAPHELSIQPHFNWLHNFLQRNKSAGMLLAICSQNNSHDVQAVFGQRHDLGLTLTDFTAHKINWKNKAANIQDLAHELNIALESVIFLDNDPVQRNQVRASLPQVLVPDLPSEPKEWPSYLKHVWAFDTFWVTEEASKRTSLYQDHAARENVRLRASSFSQFLKDLGLKISITPATEKDIPRLFELLNRVTQFNSNGIRMKESDISEMILSQYGKWFAVRVEDRFGDYGLVGAMSCRHETDLCTIGSFLLSCRALARGVENQMLRTVANYAVSQQITQLKFLIAKTSRNFPAMEFFRHLGMSESELQAGWFQLPTANALLLSDAEQSFANLYGTKHSERKSDRGTKPEESVRSGEADRILAAAIRVQNLPDLSRNVQFKGQQPQETTHTPHAVPRTEVQQRMMTLFQDLLGHDNFGIDDGFFDVGGHSLLAMRLLSRIRDAFDVDLPIRLLFMQRLTIANLATIVEAGSTPEENTAPLESIKNALDSFSDSEIAELFGDLGSDEHHES